MNTALRVSLAPGQKRHAVALAPLPLLAAGGAAVILGSASSDNGQIVPLSPAAHTLFGPRGVCVAADGSLWVSDTGHHRLLGWPRLPDADNAPAQILVGQPTFQHEGRNAPSANKSGQPGAATLNVPAGIAACGAGLVLADGWNHRVLIWHEPPRYHNQPADLVLGQADFHSVAGNRGGDQPRADTLFWPYGVAWDGARLWVADSGNRRVLVWNGLPTRNGQAADLVLGQHSFDVRDENAGATPDASSMRWPHGIAFLDGKVCVADAGNNRVMVWRQTPTANGQPCDAILGQAKSAGVDHNQGDYWPTAAALNMPYAISTIGSWLVVTDTASSRLLAWHEDDIVGSGAAAQRLAAQPDWEAKGDNRWLAATRDSLCWPFGLCSSDEYAIIADAGNNRVMLWRWSREINA